eukprot:403344631
MPKIENPEELHRKRQKTKFQFWLTNSVKFEKSLEELQSLSTAQVYDLVRDFVYADTTQNLSDFLSHYIHGQGEDQTILDIGGGTGSLLQFWQNLVSPWHNKP